MNALSPGPMNTLSARGIPDFRSMLQKCTEQSPIKDNITAEDVSAYATFLAGDGAKKITGQNLFVDGGFSVIKT